MVLPVYLDKVNTMKRFFRKSKQDVSITEEEATLDNILRYSNIILYLFVFLLKIILYLFCFIFTSWSNYILLKKELSFCHKLKFSNPAISLQLDGLSL